jgi:adenine phosphoribosyltransferase
MSELDLRAFVRDVPDFPRPGILFRDVTPLLADAAALREAVHRLAEPFRDAGVERVLGVESRGFLLGAPVALELGAGLAIARKPGKLPRRTVGVSYALEYGTDRLEMHADAIEPGQRVLVVDDLIATGGTAAATLRLARSAGADVVGCAFLIELVALGGRAQLDAKRVHAVLPY